MKYANGYLIIKGVQVKSFVCAKTYKRMLEIAEKYMFTRSELNIYWSKCGNALMKEIAQDKEGIWIAEDRLGKDYEKIK